jgi:hypothetical protein
LKIWPSMLLVFAFVNLVPVIFDAAAAVRAVHTSKLFAELESGIVLAPGVVAVPLAPALAGGAVAAVFDPPEHAVADAATRIRPTAANAVGNRMSSLQFLCRF